MASTRNPTQILVLVNVTFPGSSPVYTYLAFADGSKADPIGVGPGDEIGWFVKVQAGSGWSHPAYTLTFANPSILGTGSLSVPNGGASGFLTVQALSGVTKYTLAVSGIVPVSDPKIQVDPNGLHGVLARGVQYSVRWTAATNAMDYDDGIHGWQQFLPAGLGITPGDSVQFFAVLMPQANFEIDFPSPLNPNNVWASPFDVNASSFPATNQGAYENTDKLKVTDKSDGAGTKFTFVASLTDLSLQSAPYMFLF